MNGAPEPVCTALSYGPNYSSEDLLCDGLDNDCDGRIDVGTPRLLFSVPEFNYLRRWYGPRLLRTDAGFLAVASSDEITVLLDRAGSLISSVDAARDAGWTRPPPVLALDPGGYRVLRVSGATGYAVHYDMDGQAERDTDGGVFKRTVGFSDGGGFWSPQSVAMGPSGDVLYVFQINYGQDHLEMWHRDSDGGLIAGPAAPHAYSYGGDSVSMSDGGFGVLDYALTTSSKYPVTFTTWTDQLTPSSNSAQVDLENNPIELGWTLQEGRPIAVLQSFSPNHLWFWDPTQGNAGLVNWWVGNDSRIFREQSLADSDDPLAVGVMTAFQDAGPETLVAISADGGLKALADWTGYLTYQAPTAAAVDSQRTLVVFGYPGPQDAGYYSMMFCR